MVHVFTESFSQSVSEGFHEHDVVVVTAFLELRAHLVLLEPGRASEESNVIQLTTALRCYEVAHGHEAVLILVKLLAQGEEFGSKGLSILLVIHLNIVIFIGVTRIKSNDCSGFNFLVGDEILQHGLRSVEELLCFSAHSLVVEDFGVGSVRVLTVDLPGLKEGVPIYELCYFSQIVVQEHLSSQKAWPDDL